MMTSFIFCIDDPSYLQQVSPKPQVEHLCYSWYFNTTPHYRRGMEADIIEDIR